MNVISTGVGGTIDMETNMYKDHRIVNNWLGFKGKL